FFFQAEDGIRDKLVTGVQTCALPIYVWTLRSLLHRRRGHRQPVVTRVEKEPSIDKLAGPQSMLFVGKVGSEADAAGRLHDFVVRSEERRVGKECRSRWWPDPEKKQRR